MSNRIKISDFVKLTGSTIKTVMYYHKIGLLPEPERSPGGYRLYGPEELSRMQFIKHLKYLGMDLRRIKEVLGDIQDPRSLREVLHSFSEELLIEKRNLEERLEKITQLLGKDELSLNDESISASSFEMVTDILGSDKMEAYAKTCPELYGQHRKVFGILDGFQWGENYQETFRALAEFFQEHPVQYQKSLDLGARLSKLDRLPADDPEVEVLARESVEFIESISQLKEILFRQPGIPNSFSSIYTELVSNVVPPAQVRYGQLLKQSLPNHDDGKRR